MNKEQLQQQVNEMKAKLAEMEAELAKKGKFEWDYVRDNTFLIRPYLFDRYLNGTDKDYLEHGRYRSTKRGAELSLERNKRGNRLEALAEKLGGLKEWVRGEKNFHIYYNGYWDNDYDFLAYHPEKVYMTKDCVIEICRMLNEGEFSLDGEL